MFRKLSPLLALLLAALILAGCGQQAEPSSTEGGSDETSSQEETSSEDETVTIEYWQYNFEPRIAPMDELIKQFEAENPGIKVIHNSDVPYDQFRDKIAASVPAEKGPDVVTLYYGWVPAWVEANYLVPLPEDAFPAEKIEKEFTPLVKDARFQGKYWAVPTAVRTLALFWNKDLFQEAGLDPEKPPQTLDEFLDYAKKLTKTDDSGNYLVQGYAPELDGQAHHWWREVLVRQFGGQPYSEDSKTVQYNSPEGCEAFKWMTDLETVHKLGTDDLFGGATEAFLQGKLAMHIDGSFRLATIKKNAPDLNYGVTELPAGSDGTRSTFGSYWAHGLTSRAASDPKRMEAAVKFMQFITTPEAGALWVQQAGELPAQLEAGEDPELLSDPKLGAFAKGLSYAHATFFADESKQRQVILDAYDAVRLTGKDPCEALKEAATKEQAILDEFWQGQ